jgi:hypothetical protein
MKFPIRFDTLGVAVMTPIGLGRRHCHVEVSDDSVEVRLGWGFTATIPRSSIRSATLLPRTFLSRGAHGWKGRWLVNGAGDGLVTLTIDPPAKARVTGVPVHLRELILSMESPEGLVTALSPVD